MNAGLFGLPDARNSGAYLNKAIVRVATANGAGSTATAIRRFLTLIELLGTDITYVDSIVLGASFRINVDGIYSFAYSDSFNASGYVGLSINSTALATSIDSIALPERLSYNDTAAASVVSNTAWAGPLKAGDIIRPHGTATVANSAAINRCVFTAARIS